MKAKELKELDGWIAERVMGFNLGRVCMGKRSHWKDQNGKRYNRIPRYTLGENFQELLEKCVRHEDAIVEITTVLDGSFRLRRSDKPKEPHTVFEKTLPLAVAQFAKNLFSQK